MTNMTRISEKVREIGDFIYRTCYGGEVLCEVCSEFSPKKDMDEVPVDIDGYITGYVCSKGDCKGRYSFRRMSSLENYMKGVGSNAFRLKEGKDS